MDFDFFDDPFDIDPINYAIFEDTTRDNEDDEEDDDW